MARFDVDYFVGTAGTNLTAHTPNAGGSWAKNGAATGDIVLTNANRARPNQQNTTAIYYDGGTPATADYTVRTDEVVFGNATQVVFQVCARYSTSADSGYVVGYDGFNGGYSIYSVATGTETLLGSRVLNGSPTAGSTYLLGLVLSGTSISMTLNELVIQGPITNSNYASAGVAGLRTFYGFVPSDSNGFHAANFMAIDASTPLASIAPNDSNILAGFDPYVWQPNGATYNLSQEIGAEIQVAFSSTTDIAVSLDMSVMAANLLSTDYPTLRYSVNGGAWTDRVLNSLDGTFWAGNNLNSGQTNTLQLLVKTTNPSNDMWTTPVNGLRVTGFVVINGGASAAFPNLETDNSLFCGDSLMAAQRDIAAAGVNSDHDATYQIGRAVGKALKSRKGVMAFGGSGWQTSGSGNVPPFWVLSADNQLDNYWHNTSRLVSGKLSPAPKRVIVNHGYNDASTGLATVVQNTLSHLRSICASTTWIHVWLPPSGRVNTQITSGFNAYTAANPGDSFVSLIDFALPSAEQALINGSTAFATRMATDGTHWNIEAQERFAATLAAAIRVNEAGPSGGGGPVVGSRIVQPAKRVA